MTTNIINIANRTAAVADKSRAMYLGPSSRFVSFNDIFITLLKS